MDREKTLYIYKDDGVCLDLLPKIHDFFSKTLKNIFFVTALDLDKFNVNPNHSIFCIPGGRDVPYQKKLKDKGVKEIKKFVENGGVYIGICAGAYFASSDFEFEKGSPLEIIEKRDLCFYPKKAVGPALGNGKFSYYSENGALWPLIEFKDHNYSCPIYYNGGCCFPEVSENEKVLGWYPNDTPAIISTQILLGKAILSGVHPECVTGEKDREFLRTIFLT